MTHFFFDIRDNGILQRDEHGEDLPDIEAAIARARARFGERLRGPGEAGQEPAVRVEIRTDPEGLPSFVLDAASIGTPT